MRNETIAIHAGYDPDPTTKSVAVPIYQTVAYAFDSADHGAALFNLEAEGYRYSRIANPTTAVLEKRVADLEGGVGALAVASGQAALHFALVNLADTGGNIVPFLSYTERRTPCSPTSCRVKASQPALPTATSPMQLKSLSTVIPRPFFPRPSAIRPAMFATLKDWRRSLIVTAYHWSSIIRSPHRSC